MNNILKNKKTRKVLIIVLEFLAIAIVVYLIALPLLPSVQYKIQSTKNEDVDLQNVDEVKKLIERTMGMEIAEEDTSDGEELLINNTDNDKKSETDQKNNNLSSSTEVNTADNTNSSPTQGQVISKTVPAKTAKSVPNTLIIPKIGVKIPIIESDNEEFGLDHGAWKIPNSSTPEEDGNMILTGHRFKYLPPSNLTFYLFHKLEAGDIASVIWNNKTYLYRIKEKKVISPDDISALKQTKTSTLTMYTCDPIYSTKNRLVITAELIKD